MTVIDAMPIVICRRCGAVVIQDDRMYVDVDTCPHCGAEFKPLQLPENPVEV